MTRTALPQKHETLATRLQRDERLHPLATGMVATEVAAVLSELHAMDAIHGELSPAGVHVAIGDPPEHVSVLGFAHVGTPRGAPAFPDPATGYASPETLLGFAPDARVDCWAFGVLLYRCTYGQLPFRASHTDELLRALAFPIVVPVAFGGATDVLLSGFFERCFAHRSAARLSSARTIGATFAALLAEAARISGDAFSFLGPPPSGPGARDHGPDHGPAYEKVIPISAAFLGGKRHAG